MKTRESDMPAEEIWQSFFEPRGLLQTLGLNDQCRCVLEIGCGYGTFTTAAAELTGGTVHAIDIDPAMIAATAQKAAALQLHNVRTQLRDIVEEGSGLDDASVDAVLLFNLLHAQQRQDLLREAWRVLMPKGLLAIIHWRYDPTTPRGPSMAIRPRPEDCVEWASRVGFVATSRIIDLPPYHYGVTFRKPEAVSYATAFSSR